MTKALGASLGTSMDAHFAHPHHPASVVRHLAHELRQPLSTIEAIAYYLEMVLPDDDAKTRPQIEQLREAIQQADWILSDAVHYVQAAPPNPRTVDLRELVFQAVREISEDTKEEWIRTTLHPEATPVRFDPEQGRHMLRNVLQFFRLVAKPEPYVTVRTAVKAGWVDLEFHSHGLDLPAEDPDAVFEPFSTHLPAGSGLALASVRRIAEAHGGGIEFHPGPSGDALLRLSFQAASG